MRPRPSLTELGDRWFSSEQSTAAGMIAELQRVLRRARSHWVAVVALAALVSGGLILVIVTMALAGQSAGVDQTIIIGLINLIMVTGLYVFVGSSGVVSFGQVSFMAIGAYVCGMFTLPRRSP